MEPTGLLGESWPVFISPCTLLGCRVWGLTGFTLLEPQGLDLMFEGFRRTLLYQAMMGGKSQGVQRSSPETELHADVAWG